MINVGIECESIESDSWGIARIITKLLEEIARRPELANEFTFFLFFKSHVPHLSFLDNPIFKKVVLRPPLPLSFSLYYYVYLPIYLWFKKIDIMFFPNYMLPIIFFGTSVVNLTDDVYFEMHNPHIPFKYRLAYRVFSTWAARFATRVCTFSRTAGESVQRLFGVAPERMFVNELGVDVPAALAPRADAPDYFLFVGQAFPRRHLVETLLAFQEIAPEFPNLKFIAVGTDKYSPPRIAPLVAEIGRRIGSGRVEYRSHASDEEVAGLYRNALAVAYISSRESFGLPPLEALAHGSVPIVADTPVSRELFGDAAFFVKEPDSTRDIAEVLRVAATDTQRRAQIANAAPGILSRFTWRAYADRFLNEVRTLAS